LNGEYKHNDGDDEAHKISYFYEIVL